MSPRSPPGGRAICPSSAWPQPSLGSRQVLAPGPLHRPSPQPGSPSSQTPCGSLICFRPSHLQPPLTEAAPGQPAALAGCSFSGRSCGSQHATPVRSGTLSSPRWKGRAQPREGSGSTCCPWVTCMVGTQLAELGLQFRWRSPFSLQVPQWSPEPEGAAVLEGCSPPVLCLAPPCRSWELGRPGSAPVLTAHP